MGPHGLHLCLLTLREKGDYLTLLNQEAIIA